MRNKLKKTQNLICVYALSHKAATKKKKKKIRTLMF